MRVVGPTVWTARRKLLGNLVPALAWLIPTAAGLMRMASTAEMSGLGLWLLVVGCVLGWLVLNQVGFFQNSSIRKELEKILAARGEDVSKGKFVGFATPRYSSLIDPHEDVGFLLIEPKRLRFVSELRSVEIGLPEVKQVRYRISAHTLVGLGRWVSVEGVSNGKPIRLLLEPRVRRTMLGNLRESRRLRDELRTWQTGGTNSV